jgi:thymidine phosphorylase
MVEAQAGDPHVVDDPGSILPAAPVVSSIRSEEGGTVAAIDAESIGRAAIDLGAGRGRKGDPIDPSVGIVLHAKIGDELTRGEEIGEVHARDRDAATRAAGQVLAALTFSEGTVEPPPLVYGWHDVG